MKKIGRIFNYSIVILLVFCFSFVVVDFVWAADCVCPSGVVKTGLEDGSEACAEACGPIINNLSDGCKETGDCEVNDFVQLFALYFNLTLGIIGSIALLFFIWGGFLFLTSGGNKDKVEKGKHTLIAAVIGIIIVFSSYLIIQTVLESLGIVDNQGEIKGVGGQWDEAPE